MSHRDRFSELDQKVAAALQSTVEELRQELVDRLQETRDRLHRLIQEAAREVRAEPEPRAAGTDLADLRSATTELVTAATQGEILDSLLRVATRFSDRAAFFLVDGAGARAWAGNGFPADALAELVLPTDDGPWNRLIADQGAMQLSADDCQLVVGSLAAAPAHRGALIPLALSDRLAGALYADALDEAGGPVLEALQLLVQSASHCLESLSLRPRRLPISLRAAAETSDSSGRLDLWSVQPGGDEEE